jgi:DME family drug/metabolite transporter
MSIPVIILRQPVWIMSFNGLAIASYLGLFATALAYFLYTGGLKYTKASTAVTLSLAEPATAALLGVFFIGENFTLYSFAGVLIIFAGLLYLSLPGSLERKKI